MFRSKKVIAFILLFAFMLSTCSVGVSAASLGAGGNGLSGLFGGWISDVITPWIGNVFDSIIGATEPGTPEQLPLPPLDEDAGAEAGLGIPRAMTLDYAGGTTYKYFPVTLYNYNTELEGISGKSATINNATKALDYLSYPDSTEWKGIYFSDGTNSLGSGQSFRNYTVSSGQTSNVVRGMTPSIRKCSIQNSSRMTDGDLTNYSTITIEKNQSALLTWTFSNTKNFSSFKLNFSELGKVNYVELFVSNDDESYTSIKSWSVGSDTSELNYTPSSAVNAKYVRVLLKNSSNGNSTTVRFNEFQAFAGSSVTATRSFAIWNYWSAYFPKPSTETSDRRGWVYGGLVQKDLGSDGLPVFNYPQAGIFDSTTDTKDVYTNVQMPFKYNSLTNTYYFDSTEYNAYFPNSTFSDDATLSTHYYGTAGNFAGKSYGFYPFNSASDGNRKYHFGMSVSTTFTMTSNGRLNASDDNSDPIIFEFAGDDDVWIFIDGKLVLDLGGVHDSVSAKIDFANNKATQWCTLGGLNTGVYPEDQEPTLLKNLGKIFNDSTGTGLVSSTREAFASAGQHTLSIFYLERGQGESNSKISFNLPISDELDVTKKVSDTTASGKSLTPEQQAEIANVQFGFTLYSNTADSTIGGTPVANMRYMLFTGNIFNGIGMTNVNGYFTLKNNQTARFFVTNFSNKYYYAVENATAGYGIPGWGWSYNNNQIESGLDNYTSHVSDAFLLASDETRDRISFICTNKIDDTYFTVESETIVLDYGLPVIIDVLKNDASSSQIIFAEIANTMSGTVEIVRKDENLSGITYTPVAPGAAQKESAEESRYYLRYTPTTYINSIDVITYTLGAEGFENKSATVTIIPATSVYYEENLKTYGSDNQLSKNYISYTTAGTTVSLPASGKYQEPGVPGTQNDSPYGSDKVYMEQGLSETDSLGTYMKFDSGAVGLGTSGVNYNTTRTFRYVFTGTGTTVFARTSAESGYISVNIDGANGFSETKYIDTLYDVKTEDPLTGLPVIPLTGDTLYNVPVYDIDGLPYGTYTVTVQLAPQYKVKYERNPNYPASSSQEWIPTSEYEINELFQGRHEFYLDGIRVYNPLDPANLPVAAVEAYTADYENLNTVVSLRDKIINDSMLLPGISTTYSWAEGIISGALYTDTDGNTDSAESYLKHGPKQEVYLYSGNAFTFTLSGWFTQLAAQNNAAKIYLGAKSPEGKPIVVKINGEALTITSAVDGYYDITRWVSGSVDGSVTITVEGGLASLTNIKVTGLDSFQLLNTPHNLIH